MFGRKKKPSLLLNSVVPERVRCSLCGLTMEVMQKDGLRWVCFHGGPNAAAARCLNAGVTLKVEPGFLDTV